MLLTFARFTKSNLYPSLFYSLTLILCTQNAQGSNDIAVENKKFETFKNTYLEDFWRLHPTSALHYGYYKHDNALKIPNAETKLERDLFDKSILKALKTFHRDKLSVSNTVDYNLIKNSTLASIWYRDILKTNEWNPSNYIIASSLNVILTTNYKPINERLRTISEQLTYIPAYYAAAISNINNPTLEHTNLAILRLDGMLELFDSTIRKAADDSSLTSSEKKKFTLHLNKAIASIRHFDSKLKTIRDHAQKHNGRSFRLGEALYEEKFKHDIQSSHSAKQLYNHALKAKSDTTQKMHEITKILWPKYFASEPLPKHLNLATRRLIDHLSDNHVKADEFFGEIKKQVKEIEQFVADKDLLDIDLTKPLVVRVMPKYFRGISLASVSPAGAYDSSANTYYNASTLEEYSDKEKESLLREYNHWVMQVLNIHEATPGHYLQLMHANKVKSKIKSILGNGAMIEGWAVYSEKMMLEAGYGNGEPEFELMYLKWHLRTIVNVILDYNVHVLNISRKQALNLLIDEAFQEKTEAEKKWERATLSQVQLTSYYSGYMEIYNFREEYKKLKGKAFNLKKFHNEFLSYGSAPVSFTRELMLENIKKQRSGLEH